MKYLLLKIIALYQRTVSPDHSEWGKLRHPHGYCKYHPTCSEYAKQSIEMNGVFYGILFAARRLVKCNPFSNGGIDLVRSIRN